MNTRNFILILLLLNKSVLAQPSLRISAESFLEAMSNHPVIQAHAGEMQVLDASVDMARISPDPSLVLGNLSGDVSGIDMPHQLFVGFNFTIETGGKRKQRIRHAKAERDLAGKEHTVFVHEFKRDALLVFQECWMLEEQIRERDQLKSEILALRINDSTLLMKQQLLVMENDRHRNELEKEYAKAVVMLNDLVSHVYGDQPVLPDGLVWSPEAEVPVKEHSAAVDVAKASVEVLKEEVLLSTSNRAPDLSFTLGNSYITRATNHEAPSPSYNALTASITIPLKFSNLNGGSKRIESYRMENAQSLHVSALEESDDEWLESVREINRLVESFQQLNAVVALQEKFITKLSFDEPLVLMNELNQLNQYKTQRWEILKAIGAEKAELFARNGTWSVRRSTIVSGSN